MIPLLGSAPPTNRDELIHALTQGLGRVFDLPSGRAIVAAQGEDFPALHELSFDVSGAVVKRGLRVRLPGGTRRAGVTASAVRAVGRRVRVEGAHVDFELAAQGVAFDINHDETEHFFDPVDAEHGHFRSHIGRTDLEYLLLASAQEEVAKHGLKVERVELTLKERSDRSVHAEARVTASTKVAFATLRAVVRGQGQVAVDDEFNVALRGLTFEGEGVAGKMAAALAQKHLREFEGWSFPLSSLVLGRLKLRDLRLGCRDGLQVEASVGNR
jgi:hypothetical protein